ncbi:MAG: hypothetical protein GTO14_03055 [Anaerolineales bacterium]|nr:hypothetical protein [Anaerolineales bacterium]
MMIFIFLLLGFFLTIISHLVARYAKVRAHQHYAEIMETFGAANGSQGDGGSAWGTDRSPPESSEGDTLTRLPLPDDPWREIRPLVGAWGCLFFIFAMLRGAAFLFSLGMAVWILFG